MPTSCVLCKRIPCVCVPVFSNSFTPGWSSFGTVETGLEKRRAREVMSVVGQVRTLGAILWHCPFFLPSTPTKPKSGGEVVPFICVSSLSCCHHTAGRARVLFYCPGEQTPNMMVPGCRLQDHPTLVPWILFPPVPVRRPASFPFNHLPHYTYPIEC